MIPSLDKPKYKPLVRLKTDIWKNLQTKTLKRKKWRVLLSFLKKKKSKTLHTLLNYKKKSVSKFPSYKKYRYQKDLLLRQNIKYIYGKLQDYKINQIAHISRKESSLGFVHKLEQKPITFLYRSRLVCSYAEARLHAMHNRILVNGSYIKNSIKKGDVLHFSPSYEKVLKRRIFLNYTNTKKIKYGLHQCVDLDVNSMRFYFLDNIKYFKNHPFRLPFERVIRWYTRV